MKTQKLCPVGTFHKFTIEKQWIEREGELPDGTKTFGHWSVTKKCDNCDYAVGITGTSQSGIECHGSKENKHNFIEGTRSETLSFGDEAGLVAEFNFKRCTNCGAESAWRKDQPERKYIQLDRITKLQAEQLYSLGITEHDLPITLALASKLLREKKRIHITPQPSYTENGCVYLCFWAWFKDGEVTSKSLEDTSKRTTIKAENSDETKSYDPPFAYANYEEALSAGLDSVLSELSPGKVRKLA